VTSSSAAKEGVVIRAVDAQSDLAVQQANRSADTCHKALLTLLCWLLSGLALRLKLGRACFCCQLHTDAGLRDALCRLLAAV
jgi:hypothetical protein